MIVDMAVNRNAGREQAAYGLWTYSEYPWR